MAGTQGAETILFGRSVVHPGHRPPGCDARRQRSAQMARCAAGCLRPVSARDGLARASQRRGARVRSVSATAGIRKSMFPGPIMIIDAVLPTDVMDRPGVGRRPSHLDAGPARRAASGACQAGHGTSRPPPSRVLVVHNSYQIAGGEDAAVERETAALARAGLAVETLIVGNEEIRTPFDRLRTAVAATRSRRGVARVLEAVAAFRPDLVHVHNSFPLISPAVHGAARRAGAATVQTLHNFRLTCANGMLTRAGSPCEDCVTGSPYQAVRHGCYRGSRAGSLAVAHMIDHHRRRGTWARDVDRFIALTAFARARFIEAGVPAARISVRPNGLADPGSPGAQARSGALFVGRLTTEKGLDVLAAAARASRSGVSVIGEGPLAARLALEPKLALLGKCDAAAVQAAMAKAAVVVVPSLWYEGLPMVIAEAFAAGTPVVVSRIGALPDLVKNAETGLHVTPGDPADLAGALDWMADHPDEARRMGLAARAVYESRWAESVTTRSLLAIYAEAMASRALEAA